jgi:hypothetical protein
MVYMRQPEGFEQGGKEYVCKLNKAIYGLKQAARQWRMTLREFLEFIGFQVLESDPSIFIFAKDGVRIIMPVFIDDITIVSSSQDAISTVVSQLQERFKLRDLGPTDFLLGIKITQDMENGTVSLSQWQYCLDMLEHYGMANCNPVTTPMNPGTVLSSSMAPKDDSERDYMVDKPYRNAVGALNYLATSTRPDISYTVGKLARFGANPGPSHWKAVLHLFRYIKGTLDIQLVYNRDDSTDSFTTFSDSDHGGDVDNGKSTGGYLVKFAGGAISWGSKLQSIVALSSTEAEYIAAVDAGKEMLWMRNILQEFGEQIDGSSPLFLDNQSALCVSRNPEHHGRMKHLDLRTFWLRREVDQGTITPFHIPTAEMPADLLTKALCREKVIKFRAMMGLAA